MAPKPSFVGAGADEEAAPLPGPIWPNPSLFIPIPNLSISLGLRAWLEFEADLVAVLTGAGVSFAVASADPKVEDLVFAGSAAFSASGS